MPVPHLPHLTYKTAPLSCPACGWTGTGAETTLGESFDTFSERTCPKCPDELVALAVFPLIGEDPQYARAAERARLCCGHRSILTPRRPPGRSTCGLAMAPPRRRLNEISPTRRPSGTGSLTDWQPSTSAMPR